MSEPTHDSNPAPDGSVSAHLISAWNGLTCVAFCLSTAFMVLLSVLATQGWPAPYNHLTIGLAAVAPGLMSLLPLLCRRKVSKSWFRATFLLLLLVLLLYLNSQLSPSPWVTLKAMGLFFLSGPVAWWTGRILFQNAKYRRMFLWTLSALMLYLVFHGWVLELLRGIHLTYSAVTYNQTFSTYHYPKPALFRIFFLERYANEVVLTLSNPISAGSALLLLLAGPLLLFQKRSSFPATLVSGLLLLAGAGLIIAIGKKGTLLALGFLILLGTLRNTRLLLKVLAGLVLVFGIAWALKPTLVTGYLKGFTDSASYQLRLESWRYGADLFSQHPLFGTGFNAPLTRWLEDYTPHIDPQAFHRHMTLNNTLENMPLTLLVEMGMLFTLAYGLFLWPSLKKLPLVFKTNTSASLLSACLLAFMFHSLTFDSLRNPALNWLFHSLLAYLGTLSPAGEAPPAVAE